MLKSKNTVEVPYQRTAYCFYSLRQKSRTKANSVVCEGKIAFSLTDLLD